MGPELGEGHGEGGAGSICGLCRFGVCGKDAEDGGYPGRAFFFSRKRMPIIGRPWISSWRLRSRPCHRYWKSAIPLLSSACWKRTTDFPFFPNLAVERDIRKGRIALLHVEDVEISMYRQIFYHKNKFKTREMEEFIRLAAE